MRISDWSSDVCSSDLAVSSVIVSTAFLEATINELFSDCADAHSTERIAALQTKHLMGRLWEKGIPRTAAYPILDKYEIALELNDKSPIDSGTNPYQDVKLLVELRNALIHYEPRSEEHTSELQSLMRISYAVFCLQQKKQK